MISVRVLIEGEKVQGIGYRIDRLMSFKKK